MVNGNYTARGQLKGVGWGAGATRYVYWPDGKVKYQARTNNVTTSYEYNGRGMISSVKHRLGDDATGHDLAFREYWRDNRDRILAWKRGFDTTHNPMENGRGNRYKYYDDGQLERAWYRAENPDTESPGTPLRGDHFYYDAMGNRVGWNDVASRGSMLFQGKTNGLNQYFSWENGYGGPQQHWGTTTNYDDDVGGEWGGPGAANGVLMQDGYITAGYNALNQPIKMWGKSYFSTDWMWFGYDPLGRLVKRWKSSSGDPNTTSATFFYYDGSSLVQEGPAAGTASNIYVHGGRIDEIVASWVSGVWYNHHYDAQGSCILLSNTSGGIEQQYDYDAFGFPYFYTGSGGKAGSPKTRFLFTGREWIVDMRIYDYRARMYQPELGRFLQPDPQEFEAGDYNLYRYCHNDPVNNSDPTGLREQIAGEIMKEEIMRDIWWDMAHYADPANTSKGSFKEVTNGAYMGYAGDMASHAEKSVGSMKYRNTTSFRGNPVYHCNEFPADMAEASGRARPQVWVEPGLGKGGLTGRWRDAYSSELADPKVKIPHWSSPRAVSEARRNDIIAQRHGRDGHTGVVTAPGNSITVDTRPAYGGQVRADHWGFRPFPNNGENPQGGDPAPVVRHYLGGTGSNW